MKKFGLLLIIFISYFAVSAQPDITLEKIWEEYEFSGKRVAGFRFMNDGKHFTRQEKNIIKQYDITTGTFVKDLFIASDFKGQKGFEGEMDNYEFSSDETKLLIKTETEAIYRHSTRASFFVFDIKTKELSQVFDGKKIRYCTISPDAKKLAFVYKNNLYYSNISNGSITQITSDGENNKIINGATDWVYEEEFAFAKAFQWSPNSKFIGFMRFDESEVKEFTYTEYNDELYPIYKTFKYPKVNEKNAIVNVFIYCLKKDNNVKIELDGAAEYYIPRIKWTQNPKELCVFKMNRHQNHLQLFIANAKSGKTKLLLEEKNKYYIDITDDIRFLKDKKHMIWTSEKSGFNHIYLYDMKGNEMKALTSGNYDVTNLYGFDQKNQTIFYQAAKRNPMEREVYQVSIKNGATKTLMEKTGQNRAQFSSTFDYFINTHSTINTANDYTVHDRDGKEVRIIEDNAGIKLLQKTYNTQPVNFFSFKTSEDVELNAWMIKPANFDETKQYPVFMYLYGGPGSQQVNDVWKGMNYWWFQMLAQKGYIVACVDNRGTGARGEEFKKMTYMQLGHYETIDQIESAKYLGNLPYVDASRIGIFGWSYGGYMSSLCLLKGNDVFKAAIAVAPVTNWKWYDSVYTERYMRTEKENPDGYKNNSPVYFTDQLKGNYLLVHGMADDNVHFQHTAEMATQLIRSKKQYDTYFYPNRNHGIYGDHARFHLYTKMTNFIMEKL